MTALGLRVTPALVLKSHSCRTMGHFLLRHDVNRFLRKSFMQKMNWGNAILVIFLAALYLGARGHHAPPKPLPYDAAPSSYSAERAFEHILHIAEEPHPAGSAQADKVRDYIFAQIKQVGLAPEIQESVVYRPPSTFATTHNVVARLKGTSRTGDAIALMAHYDSVAFGPGAADDGSGVAAMLEAMRALKNGGALFNDVVFIFTDGEEGRAAGGTGLRGAYAFVEHHPWSKDIRVVINFDARGTRGQTYMYRTSGKNAWLIKHLALSRCKAATSVAYEVYSRMPVDSDLTAFIDAGIPGYDCASIHGLEKYHTMLDSPGNVSLASLQHNGEYALK
ncbi:MAG TPA: M20/M25/M40 family metallo-hydrolase, partial [Candidatus Hydrogenedentes bacterium]|nr:M20/M25/M40 family metallo-hydrolase [Candidatus Hydrogenedentota bacterium]